jgi:16S rRNA (uracil1498-N3)-methyltransferase
VRSHRAHHPTLEPTLILSALESEHLRVLRAKIGDTVTVFDGTGLEAQARIVALEPLVQLELGAVESVNLEPLQPVTLAIALLKGDKLAEVVRAATELGTSAFQLLVTEHADAKDIGTQKLERLRRITLEAAKQCGRSVVPSVLEPIKLRDLEWTGVGIVAHPRSSRLPRAVVDWTSPVTVVTGPEGGFSKGEIQTLEARGVRAVTLGKRILRAETAPVALLGALVAGEGL